MSPPFQYIIQERLSSTAGIGPEVQIKGHLYADNGSTLNRLVLPLLSARFRVDIPESSTEYCHLGDSFEVLCHSAAASVLVKSVIKLSAGKPCSPLFPTGFRCQEIP
jgi:hypothetical protein